MCFHKTVSSSKQLILSLLDVRTRSTIRAWRVVSF